MEHEKKIVFRGLLTYILYGVFYIFTLGDFIVPIPVIYIVIPLVAVYFFWLSIRSNKSWFLLALPFIVLKDIMMEFNVNIIAIVSILSLVSWVLFGVLILRQKLIVSTLQKIYGIALITSVLSLLPTDFNLSWFIFPLIGLVGYLFMKKLEEKMSVADLNNKTQLLNSANEVLDEHQFLDTSKRNEHQVTLQRITLLIILISGFYFITLFSIWSTQW